MNLPTTGYPVVDIVRHIPKTGPGVTAYQVLKADLPDRPIIDVLNALKQAEREGELTRLGSYYWRK